jgi:hypothetical protein
LGNYLAVASDEFKAPYTLEWPNWFPPDMDIPPTKNALDDVLTQLLSDGSEPYGKGEWGLPKFRRLAD